MAYKHHKDKDLSVFCIAVSPKSRFVPGTYFVFSESLLSEEKFVSIAKLKRKKKAENNLFYFVFIQKTKLSGET